MLGTTPEVESVMRRLEMAMPSPSATTSSASRTASKLYSGSPIPIITMLETRRSLAGGAPGSSPGSMAASGIAACNPEPGDLRDHSPSRSRATMIWPTISPDVRLRTSRCVPVWQNEQVRVQPT